MSYRVRTDNFEGPFDLLLYLVSRQRVDIGAISIAEIVDQYLAEVSRMQRLDLDVASDFLLVASTLLELKAQSLLPKDEDAVDEDIVDLAPNEARDLLVERLLVYKQYKNAAEMLASRAEDQAKLHERTAGAGPQFKDVAPDFLEGVSLDALGFLAAQTYGRRDIRLLESEHIAAKPIPVELHVRAIHRRIAAEKHVTFSQLVGPETSTQVKVVTFLALLELYKRQMVDLRQDSLFGDISVDYIEESGELTLSGEDALTSVGEQ